MRRNAPLTGLSLCRYIAICEPLRYHAIMTSARMHTCCALAWLVAFLCIAVLFSFHVDVPLCGNTIQHVYCSNRGILNLACGPTSISNIYGQCTCLKDSDKKQTPEDLLKGCSLSTGLSMNWSMSTGTFLIIAFSYIRILQTCLKQSRTVISVHSKALQICASHLVVFVLYEISATIIVVTLRFPSLPQNITKFCGILVIIVPPFVNPIIYGLVSKDLRSSILKRLTNKVRHKS